MHLVPLQWIQFIRTIIDAIVSKAFLPLDCAHSIWTVICMVRGQHASEAVLVQRLLGHMAATVSVLPHTKLCMRPLQLSFLKQFRPHKHSQSKPVQFSMSIKDSLIRWTSSKNIFQGTSFHPPQPTSVLTTEGSLSGWGVHFAGMCT